MTRDQAQEILTRLSEEEQLWMVHAIGVLLFDLDIKRIGLKKNAAIQELAGYPVTRELRQLIWPALSTPEQPGTHMVPTDAATTHEQL